MHILHCGDHNRTAKTGGSTKLPRETFIENVSLAKLVHVASGLHAVLMGPADNEAMFGG